MEDDPRLASLAEYRSRLETLLTLFDSGEGPPDAVLKNAWQGCAEAFESFRKLQEENQEPTSSVELDRAIRDSLRLNVVAVAAIARHRSELTQKKRVLKRAREVLRTQETRSPKGRSCDIQG